jgi:SPP1 family phage portal protein
MKQNRVLLLPQDSDADFLIKQQSDALVENIKIRLNNDIHRFSGCPDMSDQNFAGNASGVAIRYKLLQFENIAGTKEREFKRGLQRRLELLCNIWAVKGRGTFDWRDVQISFKRALPQNLLELSQTLANLGALLSDETKRTLLPIDVDEETERKRIEAQKKAGMSLFGMPDTFEELTIDGNAATEEQA